MTKIIPELKYIHSPDVDDLDNPNFSEEKPYCVFVQAMFGIKGVDGEESFGFSVCNIEWVKDRLAIGPFSPRHYLIVSKFDIEEIRSYLEQAATNITAQTWGEVGQKLGRIGKWEFEDYNQHRAI